MKHHSPEIFFLSAPGNAAGIGLPVPALTIATDARRMAAPALRACPGACHVL